MPLFVTYAFFDGLVRGTLRPGLVKVEWDELEVENQSNGSGDVQREAGCLEFGEGWGCKSRCARE